MYTCIASNSALHTDIMEEVLFVPDFTWEGDSQPPEYMPSLESACTTTYYDMPAMEVRFAPPSPVSATEAARAETCMPRYRVFFMTSQPQIYRYQV